LAAFLMAAALPVLAETSTLRLSLPISIESPAGQNIREFARQVQARTSGEIKVAFDGRDRRQEHEIVAAVASGAVEIGATTLNQLANDVPLARAFLQPFLFNFDALIQAATNQGSEIRELIEKDILKRRRMRVLWWQPYGSSVLFSKGAPVTSPSTIAARPVGTTDDLLRELIGICGGAARPVAPSDVFAQLQKGTIQAAATDIMNVQEGDLWRAADTVTKLRHAPSLLLIVINDRAWQSLTSEQQEILTELGQDAQAYMWARFATISADAYARAAQKGMRIVEVPGEDITAWRACSAPLMERYMDGAGDAGRKLFAAYGKLRTDPCCREVPGDASFAQR
jgi:C4-dicarboxylate-binding protein DctP